MLQQTVARIEPLVPPDRILIVTGADQAEATRAQLPDLPADNVIAEPCPRDTAPCVGLAAGIVAAKDPAGTMIVMPADHVIEPAEAFRTTVRAAVAVIDDDPDRAGHLRHHADAPGDRLRLHRARARCWRRATASRSTASSSSARSPTAPRPSGSWPPATSRGTRGSSSGERGRSWTRSGRIAPQLAEGLEPILRALGTPDEAETLARLFPALERVPIDKAVMEHAPNVRVLEVPYDWNDVGDWRALASLLERDAAGNAIQGHVVARDTTGSIIISDDGGLVATLGVDDLVVVHSGKATLVARKDQLDKLKALVEGLGEAGYGSYL